MDSHNNGGLIEVDHADQPDVKFSNPSHPVLTYQLGVLAKFGSLWYVIPSLGADRLPTSLPNFINTKDEALHFINEIGAICSLAEEDASIFAFEEYGELSLLGSGAHEDVSLLAPSAWYGKILRKEYRCPTYVHPHHLEEFYGFTEKYYAQHFRRNFSKSFKKTA